MTAPQLPPSPREEASSWLTWAQERHEAEVDHRPVHNVHRHTLDVTWRKIIKRATERAKRPARDITEETKSWLEWAQERYRIEVEEDPKNKRRHTLQTTWNQVIRHARERSNIPDNN